MTVRELIISKIDINKKIEDAGGFTQSEQVLLLIEDGFTTPKMLIEKMGIQKTNLSGICRQLLETNLIARETKRDNLKEIVYCLCPEGRNMLNKKIQTIENNLMERNNENL